MSRVNLEGLRARDIRHGPGFTFQSEIVTPATGHVVSPNAPTMLMMNPAGAVNVRLPTSAETMSMTLGVPTTGWRGLVFIFVNLSGNVITLQTDGGAAFATAISVAANASNRVVCTGNATQNLGWIVW